MFTFNQPTPSALKLETALIFLLGMVIFLSKPMIYLTILLLFVLTAVRLAKSPPYRHEMFGSRIFWASVAVFVLGVLAAAIGSDYTEDLGWMAKKTLPLMMIVPLLLAFSQKTNRTAALTGVVLGFWIAFVLTGNIHYWSWSGERWSGATWLVDTWGVLCAMLILLLTPLVFLTTQNWQWRVVLIATILGALVMLIFNGARGPFVGVAAGLSTYLLFKQQKAFLIIAALTIFSFFSVSQLIPQQTAAVKDSYASIVDFENNPSSYVRLALWEVGAALIKKQLVDGDKEFFWGNGHTGKGELANDFYYNYFIDHAVISPDKLLKLNWKINDLHNMYLESIFQNGILWTIGSLVILLWLGIGPLWRRKGLTKTWAAVPSLIGFLVFGITYTLLPHFAFLFLIFFLALGRGFELDNVGDESLR